MIFSNATDGGCKSSCKAEQRIGDVIMNNELSIRPKMLDDYIGQTKAKENMKVYIESSKKKGRTLDHVLLYGPPGLGKTTLSNIIANELGVNIKITSAPAIKDVKDLTNILSEIKENDVLFIDEIHRISRQIEEVLYSAMEDFKLDIVLGDNKTARTITINLPHFTLVGATTRAGDLTAPLRDRFGIVCKLEYYTTDELKQIIKRTAKIYEMDIKDDASEELAKRARKTPRIANKLLKRIIDFAVVENKNVITKEQTMEALERLEIDNQGLDSNDIEYLKVIIDNYNGGPVGVETIATALGEEVNTVKDVIESYLVQEKFIQRTSKGRIATDKAFKHLNRK